MNITEKLNKIQTELNAPKDAFNAFARYHYRSAESILQAVKPLLKETGLVLTISDTVEAIGNRIYIKATAKVSDGEHSMEAVAFAREPESKKGSDESQITGAASSYARKYALCGLFAIDDNKDADATNTHCKEQPAQPATTTKPFDLNKALSAIAGASDIETLQKYQEKALEKAENEGQKKAINEASKQRFNQFNQESE